MGSYYSQVFVHLVWGTAGRRPLLTPDLWRLLNLRARGVSSDRRCVLLALGGTEDHVHGLVVLHPATSISSLVGSLKGETSGLFRRRGGPADFRWQEGYGVFSFSPLALPRLDAYVRNQVEHHRRGDTIHACEHSGL
ncbi:MAG: transposase [Deltaproteobacteria bacterium]|nr:transposase [Deltaproteobacteria bacterium]